MLAVAASLVAAAAPTVAPAAHAAGPTLAVTSVVSVDRPRQVPAAASGQTVTLSFTVSSSEPIADVTVKAYTEDGGLVVGNANQSLGTVTAPRTVSFPVAGATPGLHELLIDVVAPTTSAYGSIPDVFTSGSPLFPGTDELDPMTFGWQGTTHVAGSESSTRAVAMLTILPGGFAYVGLPAKGRPKCTHEGNGCLRYAYDDEYEILQVGNRIIGELQGEGDPPGLYTEGLAPDDPQHGAPFGGADVTGTSDFAGPTTTLLGTYAYSSADHPTGMSYEKVTFRPHGKYRLAYAVNGGKVKKLTGTFSLRRKGKITFRSKAGHVVQRGTVLVLDKTSPDAGPFRPGIWLILSGKKAKRPDGNLLLQK